MKIISLAVALSLGLAASAAAEPANPDVSARMAAEEYVRVAAAPADKRLAGMSGEAAVWAGDPIWKLLIYCGAVHSNQRQILAKQGAAPAVLAEQDRLSKSFNDLATARFTKDRGVTAGAAFEALVSENAFWTFGLEQRTVDFQAESRTCRTGEIRNRMAG